MRHQFRPRRRQREEERGTGPGKAKIITASQVGTPQFCHVRHSSRPAQVPLRHPIVDRLEWIVDEARVACSRARRGTAAAAWCAGRSESPMRSWGLGAISDEVEHEERPHSKGCQTRIEIEMQDRGKRGGGAVASDVAVDSPEKGEYFPSTTRGSLDIILQRGSRKYQSWLQR